MDVKYEGPADHLVIPLPVRHALRKLGGDIRDAQRRRRLPTAIAAQHAKHVHEYGMCVHYAVSSPIKERVLPWPQQGVARTSTFSWTPRKSSGAQKALRAKTETETVERALGLAIAEHESNRLVLEATERFVKSGIDIKGIYVTLGG